MEILRVAIFLGSVLTRDSSKDYIIQIPNDLKLSLAYKFTCASCSSSYIGKTCGHLKTRIEDHIKKDNKSPISNIYNPLQHALTHTILFVLK